VARPKPDGYRAKHLVVRKDGVLIEVQLRTATQHAWAELVEQLDRDHGLQLKARRADSRVTATLQRASETFAQLEAGELDGLLGAHEAASVASWLGPLTPLRRDEAVD